MFIWTGFDYLGEPTPYGWPSRSSYFGIVDLAGFPKDAYYMYQSEWTDTPVLHIFPHWNWAPGKIVDVWAYTSCDEVELFLNGESKGIRKKAGDTLHLSWELTYEPGTLRAVGRTAGKETLVREVKTAGPAAKIVLEPDRTSLSADGSDMSFVTVKVVDKAGTLVPDAGNLVTFQVSGAGRIAGVDNGLQTSLEPFKASHRKAFNGLCLAVIQSTGIPGEISISASAEGLEAASAVITSR
jgi:beta-galactosidase